MKQTTEKRMLAYIFTPEEHLANCAEMARLADAMSELESTQKSIKAQLKEDLEAISAEFGRHVRLVRDKRDHRQIECRWIMDCPAVGQKTLRRNDTDIDVEVRRMEEFEKQESLNLQPVTEELPLGLPLESAAAIVEGMNSVPRSNAPIAGIQDQGGEIRMASHDDKVAVHLPFDEKEMVLVDGIAYWKKPEQTSNVVDAEFTDVAEAPAPAPSPAPATKKSRFGPRD